MHGNGDQFRTHSDLCVDMIQRGLKLGARTSIVRQANDRSGWSVSLSADGQTVAIGSYQASSLIEGQWQVNSGHVPGFIRMGWFLRGNQVGSDIDGEASKVTARAGPSHFPPMDRPLQLVRIPTIAMAIILSMVTFAFLFVERALSWNQLGAGH